MCSYDSDCPSVASGRLVSFACESALGLSSSVVAMVVSAPPDSSPPLSQVYRGTSPSRVDSPASSEREAFCGRLLDLLSIWSDSPLPEFIR
ncbi:hypothetical protein E2C01_055033 [Portunus trituberculatus]|uniref:Uncharacterized protein n=1 Tax=Portunus trituberculatus TaxID=210409 RepID=A0A5B7GLD2_PORTR|nr:hypothetical protein [Portunus trituberculatus]